MPRCSRCHSLVESRKLLLEKWVVPGNAASSDLFEATDGGSMPPYGNKLLDEEVEAIRLWIEAGAPND
jgi:mono/diheme cytochrome c family protein